MGGGADGAADVEGAHCPAKDQQTCAELADTADTTGCHQEAYRRGLGCMFCPMGGRQAGCRWTQQEGVCPQLRSA